MKIVLDFTQIRVDKPDRITFNKVRLRPSWFVNTDSRKFVFTDVEWENYKSAKSELKNELAYLTRKKHKKPHNYQILIVSLRNLASNAEEFNRFEDGSNFRKSASECERLERINRQKQWCRRLKKQWWRKNIVCWQILSEIGKSFNETKSLVKKHHFDPLHFLYRWLSGYGEKWFRAFLWLIVIWIFFAIFYSVFGSFGSSEPTKIDFLKSFGYSLQVMTLQKPEPRPYDWLTYLAYGLETILAPVQGALLALAIRRKFMR